MGVGCEAAGCGPGRAAGNTGVGRPPTPGPSASALGRIAVSEVLRHVLSLSRARNVRETHGMTGDALVIVRIGPVPRLAVRPPRRVNVALFLGPDRHWGAVRVELAVKVKALLPQFPLL